MYDGFIEEFIEKNNLIDIGATGKATQSSFFKSFDESKFRSSNRDDAQMAIEGGEYFDYAFHTAHELNPWWRVDFSDLVELAYVIVNNRKHERYWENSHLTEVSIVNQYDEEILLHQGSTFFGSLPERLPLIIPHNPKVKIKAIIVRNSISDKSSFLHLGNIYVLAKKYST